MHDIVKDYYGRQLQGTADLRTTVCCDASQTPEWHKPLLARIHPEVTARYYGCGLVCPPLLGGGRVLDLGCGTGRDLFALTQLVGEGGQVVGVDMTEAQLAVAERHREHHRRAFGFARDNVDLRLGYLWWARTWHSARGASRAVRRRSFRVPRQPQSHELPALLGVEEVAVARPDVVPGGGAGAPA